MTVQPAPSLKTAPLTETASSQAAPLPASAALGDVRDYFALLKPRVMSLVIFTALVGMVAAPGAMNPVLAAASILAIAVGAGAAGALNMWYDAEIDRRMTRTRRRPIPAGKVAASDALVFGTVFSVFSVLTLALAANYLAAALLAFTIAFYVFVYTMWLKRRTPQNIVIGGAAGALPPVIGWAAATGTLGVEPVVLFMIIFLWTPPHFWALSLYKAGDYEKAGVPMLPVARGDRVTRRHIWFYSLVLVATGVSPWLLGFAGALYAAVSIGAGAIFVLLAWRVLRQAPAAQPAADAEDGLYAPGASNRAARDLFAFSILYLFLLFASLLIEHGFDIVVSG